MGYNTCTMGHVESPEDIEVLYPDIARRIIEMTKIDQEMRERSLQQGGLIVEEDEQIDFNNTEEMKRIVGKIGWPTISKVGKEGSFNAWLLVQHADHDVSFQKQCLELMLAEPPSEVAPENRAYLEDRVRVKEGRLQLYGTQFFGEGDKYAPRPIEDEENVDKRRAMVGLETMAEYRKILHGKYAKYLPVIDQ